MSDGVAADPGPRRFLGVDAGGTKTEFVVVDDAGAVVARDRQAGAYAFDGGTARVAEVLAAGLDALAADGVDLAALTFAAFGLPAYGERAADVPELDAIPGRLLGHDRYVCANDMVGAWAGSLGGADGINVIAGTGSMASGERTSDGTTRRTRVGGWSELFGDEGSAYWIGAEGLRAFTRMADGRAARTALHDRIRGALGLAPDDDDLQVIGAVMADRGGRRDEIAALAVVVLEAADDGDPAARRIVADAHEELVALVRAARTGLGYDPADTAPVSWSGGLFRSASFRAGFVARLAAEPLRYDARDPVTGPGIGTALYARRRHRERAAATGAPAQDATGAPAQDATGAQA